MKTTTRTWLHALVLGVLLLRVNASEKPNILFILVDDMGWSDIGCYGGEIETPHIDSLSKQGVRFTQFYNTAKCMSSRGCLLTGLYAQQCGMSRRPDKLINAVTLARCCALPDTGPGRRANTTARKTYTIVDSITTTDYATAVVTSGTPG
ncbi:sulfatase-like hydrolase/transferase [Rubritalea profundi]|uniref:Sulfatase N-terminal domain-containing protein n=1 Tax=Rubritalea profundi TaxID=1658618 RepID=A0A2S7U3H7_9BACT|nr:sulfatase-like hydrolase/transferase [Rubritalea profundi]PQJ29568.1 hypothetical protein BSZ32_14425 [Rubritalea profundi]